MRADPLPEWLARGRVPSLDGLRAAAIGLVLLAHSVYGSHKPFWGRLYHAGVPQAIGSLGVGIFFVISGFLITLLLRREEERGAVRLRAFYVRRSLRIMPAYAAYLLVIGLLDRAGYWSVTPRNWLGAVTYTANFDGTVPWAIGHLWSLSVEEQFYLLWPPLLAWLGAARCRPLTYGYLAMTPPALVAGHVWHYEVLVHALTQFASIAAGCLLALECHRPGFHPSAGPRKGYGAARPIAIGAALAASVALALRSPFYAFAASVIDPALCAALLWTCVRERSAVTRLLNTRGLTTIGLLSYSLYLWQQLFLDPVHPRWWTRSPASLLLTLAVAAVSYCCVEQPFLQLKVKWR